MSSESAFNASRWWFNEFHYIKSTSLMGFMGVHSLVLPVDCLQFIMLLAWRNCIFNFSLDIDKMNFDSNEPTDMASGSIDIYFSYLVSIWKMIKLLIANPSQANITYKSTTGSFVSWYEPVYFIAYLLKEIYYFPRVCTVYCLADQDNFQMWTFLFLFDLCPRWW